MTIPWIPQSDVAANVADRFHARHHDTFAYSDREIVIQATAVRLSAFGLSLAERLHHVLPLLTRLVIGYAFLRAGLDGIRAFPKPY